MANAEEKGPQNRISSDEAIYVIADPTFQIKRSAHVEGAQTPYMKITTKIFELVKSDSQDKDIV